MADTETHTPANGATKARAKTRSKAAAAHPARAHATAAEPRSFAKAGEAAVQKAAKTARQTANASLKAGQEMVQAGQEAARRSTGQAADLWRASLDPLSHMQGEFARWFEQMWRQAAGGRQHPADLLRDIVIAPFAGAPSVDLHETDAAIELTAELPGLKAQDVHLAIKGDSLILSGHKAESTDRQAGAFHVKERRFGAFQRSFALPPGVDKARIDASFSDGVLRVSIAKSTQPSDPGKRIPIKG